MPAVVIPRVLRDTFGDEASESLVDFINQLMDSSRQETLVLVDEKFERRLTEEFARLRSEDLVNLDKRITEEIGRLRSEDLVNLDKRITEEIGRLRSEDIAGLRQEIAESNARLRQEIAESNARLRQEIAESNAQLRTEIHQEIGKLRAEMAEHRADLIRWMFIFWVGQLGAILAILFVFFR